MSGPLFVNVDWARNGVITDAGDDVTARVRGAISAEYGRDQVSALSPVVGGRGSFELDNRSRDYSPRNVSSPLFGNIKPRRPVLITRVVSGTTYTIFRGHTDDSPIDPDLERKTVTVNLVDDLSDLRGINVTTTLYQGIRTGAAIGLILDAIGWTGGRDIDTGITLIPWYWLDGVDAFTALQDILASEGSPALATIDPTGAFVFRDRQHRLIRAASTVSQATFRGTERSAEPVMSKGYSYSDAWQNIVNSVSLTVDERKGSLEYSAVFSTDDVINIPASSTITILVHASDPFRDAVTPILTTDYTVGTGSVSSVTLSSTSGTATTISVTAGGTATTVIGLQLRARSVPVVRSYQVTATDSASITDYGQRSNPSGTDPVWASLYDAQDIATELVLQRKQPLPILSVRFSCQGNQTTRLAKVLSLDLSDRVTVIETETAVNSDFFVESITHSVASLYEHEITFGLEAVPASPTSVFTLNTSTLNSASPLGY